MISRRHAIGGLFVSALATIGLPRLSRRVADHFDGLPPLRKGETFQVCIRGQSDADNWYRLDLPSVTISLQRELHRNGPDIWQAIMRPTATLTVREGDR